MTWRDHAACNNTDLDVFYPEVKQGSQESSYKPAIAICNTCPVQQECLDAAIQEELYASGRVDVICQGARGGTTPNQRRAIIRQNYPDRRQIQNEFFTYRHLIEDGKGGMRFIRSAIMNHEDRLWYGYESVVA